MNDVKQKKVVPLMGAWVYGAFVALVAAVVFAPAVGGSFVYLEDGANIYRNPHLGALTGERAKWLLTEATVAGAYQPLTWLGWFLNFRLGRLNASGYHLGNWLLHLGSAMALFAGLRLFLRRVAEVSGLANLRGADWAACAGAGRRRMTAGPAHRPP